MGGGRSGGRPGATRSPGRRSSGSVRSEARAQASALEYVRLGPWIGPGPRQIGFIAWIHCGDHPKHLERHRRSVAWPSRKGDTHKSRRVHCFQSGFIANIVAVGAKFRPHPSTEHRIPSEFPNGRSASRPASAPELCPNPSVERKAKRRRIKRRTRDVRPPSSTCSTEAPPRHTQCWWTIASGLAFLQVL